MFDTLMAAAALVVPGGTAALAHETPADGKSADDDETPVPGVALQGKP